MHTLVKAGHAGSIFVCSDIHGRLDMLHRILHHVNFDEQCDLLISVGDLVDRGKSSLDVLRLLRQPCFLAVRGNHEFMFTHFLDQITSIADRDGDISQCVADYVAGPNGRGIPAYGAEWLFEEIQRGGMASLEELNAFAGAVKRLPLRHQIVYANNSVTVVHAGLFSLSPARSLLAEQRRIVAMTDPQEQKSADAALVQSHEGRMLWGRELRRVALEDFLKHHGLSMDEAMLAHLPELREDFCSFHEAERQRGDHADYAICGHAHTDNPDLVYDHLNIDQSCVKEVSVTVCRLPSGSGFVPEACTFYKGTAKGVQVQHLDNHASGSGIWGDCVDLAQWLVDEKNGAHAH